MPKTGSSSIQDYLYYWLNDRRYRYIGLGGVNSGGALDALCGDNPEAFWEHQMRGISGLRFRRYQQTCSRRLRQALAAARRQGVIPILSAERCWHFRSGELVRLRQLLHEQDFDVKVLVYLRPFKAFLESSFQQNVKWGLDRFDQFVSQSSSDGGSLLAMSRYGLRLAALEEVFGIDRLSVRRFASAQLVGGCAVQDFCSWAGIVGAGDGVPRINDGVNLDALRLLYAYNKYARSADRITVRSNTALLLHLQSLPGAKVSLHSSLLMPWLDQLELERQQIRSRYGVDLGDPLSTTDGPDALRQEEDLGRFSVASLQWLAAASGCAPAAAGPGDHQARAVAEQMVRLRRRVVRLQWRPLLRDRVRLQWRQLRQAA